MPDTSSPSAAPPAEAAPFAFLTRAEAATAAAAMGRIFPDDELGPGAIAAGTVYYLDRALAGAESHLQDYLSRPACAGSMRSQCPGSAPRSRIAAPGSRTS